jgi:hypothetical protein
MQHVLSRNIMRVYLEKMSYRSLKGPFGKFLAETSYHLFIRWTFRDLDTSCSSDGLRRDLDMQCNH